MKEEDPQLLRQPIWHRTLLVLPASHLWRSFPSWETNVRGSTHPKQLLYETPLLYLGLRSHWHQHCHLGCNYGLPKQRESWDSSPTRLLRMNRWEPQDCFWGWLVFLRMYFQTARFWNFLYSLWGPLHFATQCRISVHCLFLNAMFS